MAGPVHRPAPAPFGRGPVDWALSGDSCTDQQPDGQRNGYKQRGQNFSIALPGGKFPKLCTHVHHSSSVQSLSTIRPDQVEKDYTISLLDARLMRETGSRELRSSSLP